MRQIWEKIIGFRYGAKITAGDWLKYIGPGLMVTVGFIDPGNWAANVAAGSEFGYSLLWVVTVSTLMLIMLQHNAAHLGIVTGDCISESATRHLRPWVSRTLLGSAMIAVIATALAELLGGAIALKMLLNIPIKFGALIMCITTIIMLFGHAYRPLEKWIIGFVSLIGLSFIYELTVIPVDWSAAAIASVTPSFPQGSMLIIMSVLGAVVMPHNLFLHSEVIQSRRWDLSDQETKERQLRYEFLDTLFSMGVGWAINCAIIIVAAATFFPQGIKISDLSQAQGLLTPLIGRMSGVVFALALLFAGIASSVTSSMAGGSIFAGIYSEPFDIKDSHTRMGVMITMLPALAIIWLISDPFRGLILSQAALSLQLPLTIFLQVYLTSSQRVMKSYRNTPLSRVVLTGTGLFVTGLNIYLLQQMIVG